MGGGSCMDTTFSDWQQRNVAATTQSTQSDLPWDFLAVWTRTIKSRARDTSLWDRTRPKGPHTEWLLVLLQMEVNFLRRIALTVPQLWNNNTAGRSKLSRLEILKPNVTRLCTLIANDILRVRAMNQHVYGEVPAEVEAALVPLRRVAEVCEERLVTLRQDLEDQARETGLRNAQMSMAETRGAITCRSRLQDVLSYSAHN